MASVLFTETDSVRAGLSNDEDEQAKSSGNEFAAITVGNDEANETVAIANQDTILDANQDLIVSCIQKGAMHIAPELHAEPGQRTERGTEISIGNAVVANTHCLLCSHCKSGSPPSDSSWNTVAEIAPDLRCPNAPAGTH